MSDDQFSHAFKDIVPDPPTPQGWADGARRRRRHKSQLMAGAVGAVAVALAIPVGINLANHNLVATPAPASAPGEETPSSEPAPATAGLLGAPACYGEDGQLLHVTEGDGIKPGAVKAWLCGDGNVVGPLEPLVTDVDRIVDFVTAQAPLPADLACTMEYRLSYNVVLEYSDGTRRPVMGELHGCRTINDGATVRRGGEEFYSFVRGLWREQRAGMDAPAEGSRITACPVPQTMVAPDLDRIRHGLFCVVAENRSEVTFIDDALAGRIGADIKANAVKGEPTAWAGPGVTLTLIGPWGDTLTLNPNADGPGYWFVDGEDATWLWTPSADVQELLDGIPIPVVAPTATDAPTDPPAATDPPAFPGEAPSVDAPATTGQPAATS